MDLPTYTKIWRIEKRLYKLYDFRLPMPLPLVTFSVWLGVTVVWMLLMSLLGVPFATPWHVLWIVPPMVIAFFATRPVVEGKRLTELVFSQGRYLAEARVYTRLTPEREPRVILVGVRVWHRDPAAGPLPLTATAQKQQSRAAKAADRERKRALRPAKARTALASPPSAPEPAPTRSAPARSERDTDRPGLRAAPRAALNYLGFGLPKTAKQSTPASGTPAAERRELGTAKRREHAPSRLSWGPEREHARGGNGAEAGAARGTETAEDADTGSGEWLTSLRTSSGETPWPLASKHSHEHSHEHAAAAPPAVESKAARRRAEEIMAAPDPEAAGWRVGERAPTAEQERVEHRRALEQAADTGAPEAAREAAPDPGAAEGSKRLRGRSQGREVARRLEHEREAVRHEAPPPPAKAQGRGAPATEGDPHARSAAPRRRPHAAPWNLPAAGPAAAQSGAVDTGADEAVAARPAGGSGHDDPEITAASFAAESLAYVDGPAAAEPTEPAGAAESKGTEEPKGAEEAAEGAAEEAKEPERAGEPAETARAGDAEGPEGIGESERAEESKGGEPKGAEGAEGAAPAVPTAEHHPDDAKPALELDHGTGEHESFSDSGGPDSPVVRRPTLAEIEAAEQAAFAARRPRAARPGQPGVEEPASDAAAAGAVAAASAHEAAAVPNAAEVPGDRGDGPAAPQEAAESRTVPTADAPVRPAADDSETAADSEAAPPVPAAAEGEDALGDAATTEPEQAAAEPTEATAETGTEPSAESGTDTGGDLLAAPAADPDGAADAAQALDAEAADPGAEDADESAASGPAAPEVAAPIAPAASTAAAPIVPAVPAVAAPIAPAVPAPPDPVVPAAATEQPDAAGAADGTSDDAPAAPAAAADVDTQPHPAPTGPPRSNRLSRSMRSNGPATPGEPAKAKRAPTHAERPGGAPAPKRDTAPPSRPVRRTRPVEVEAGDDSVFTRVAQNARRLGQLFTPAGGVPAPKDDTEKPAPAAKPDLQLDHGTGEHDALTATPERRPDRPARAATPAPARPVPEPADEPAAPPDSGATRGWRRLARVVTGGNASAAAKTDVPEADIRRLRTEFTGTRRIIVLGCTGGAGQSMTALMLGHTLAAHRDQRVVAVDVNPGGAGLSRRIRTETTETLTSLFANAERIQGYAGMRGYTSQSPSGLEVVTTLDDPYVQTLDDRDYVGLAQLLERHYEITLLDPAAPGVARALPIADALVLVAPANADAARAVAMTFEWLDGHGYANLRAKSVVVVNGVSRRSLADVDAAEQVARGRCRAIARVPWDDHLASARAVIDVSALRPTTRRAHAALGGVLAGGFAAGPTPGTRVTSEARR
ncbi:MinD-like ATPase involved in chromosome partitioning or flagellar assembly [Murinocardiopsis flavida]|uniref:MinD-like ATPase involved in chromosome partitioning or flagellar assembly n=1 Tax=Murinocardiopsis flavida TaxID=645275 RepID=A0A2P8DJC0_9ACTN|nr:conjugal transfer protein [Murinocardiopsis flavida]PSK97294.1 MinD-like ATPase involved in chromosome partitioning or flagellar assembly [Murinocardiopsis flavida]